MIHLKYKREQWILMLQSMESLLTLHVTFKNLSLAEFYCTIKKEFPEFSENVIKILLFFLITRMCGAGFSLHIKEITHDNKLNTANI